MNVTRLTDVLQELDSGSRPKGGVSAVSGEILSIGAEHLSGDGGFSLQSPKRISQDFYEDIRKGHIAPGNILVVKDGATTGKTSLVREDSFDGRAAVNEHVFRLVVDSGKAYSPYVFHYLRTKKGQTQILSRFHGAAQGGITKEFTDSVRFPLPPLSEQKRIAAILDKADELRRKRRETIAKLDTLTQSIFLDMFGDPNTNPKHWPIVPISSFVSEFQGGNSILSEGDESENDIYRVLKVSAVTWGDYRPHESKPVPLGYEPPKKHIVRKGDLLFSRANTTELVGATAYVFDTPPNMLLPDKLWRFVWKEPCAAEPLYVCMLFQNVRTRRDLGKRATGTSGSMKNISKPKVMSLQVYMPPLPLQRSFAARVAEVREMEQSQFHSCDKLNVLFVSMQDKAFKGEL